MKNKNSNKGQEKKIELLAPAGSLDAGYAALHYGADAVYLGLENFSARSSAVNFTVDDLADITGYAHSLPGRRKIFIAVNTLVQQKELGELIDLLSAIAGIGVDAVIIQDLGVLNILRRYFPRIKIHASTQMAIHNLQGAQAAGKMGIGRVTLSRELTLSEIAEIAVKPGIETEVFIHGALCYSYSGLCLFSSHLKGRSGNRGTCAYPCREAFMPVLPVNKNGRDNTRPSTPNEWSKDCAMEGHALSCPQIGNQGGFIFSMKDLALPEYIAELRRIGVTALKIEGRMKSPLYVAAVVNYYRRLIDGKLSPEKERELASDVQTIFSRPLTDLYLGTRRNRGVTDIATLGHRGSPAGKVEEIASNSGGHCLRFQTSLPLELHDGLQIDIAGLPRPFGFAVKNINLIGDGRSPGKKRVFTAPAGARVEIQIPSGHPAIPRGAVIYSSSSQKVKQQYDFFRPKLRQFRMRHAVDFNIRMDENGIEVIASADVFSGIKGEPARAEAKKHFNGIFQPADNVSQINGAIAGAFEKLGNTGLKPGRLAIDNPHNLFIPVSLLNSIRRDISEALEREISEVSRQYAEKIKSEMLSAVIPDMPASGGHRWESRECSALDSRLRGNDTGKRDEQARDQFIGGNFKWNIMTDQPHLLFSFSPEDWRGIDEVIIECLPGNLHYFSEQLDRLSGAVGKSRVRLSLPVIMRQWETEPFAKTVPELTTNGWHKWQISNFGAWSLLDNLQKSGAQLDISADWPLYAMNRAAVGQLRAMGINKFTLSPEDGFENMRELLGEFSSGAVVIVYQDTPLMVSETCVFASEKCSDQGVCNFRETIFCSSHADKILVINSNCRSIVINSRPFCLVNHLRELADAGAVNFRADFINRGYSEKELLDTWRIIRSGAKISSGHIANFNRGFG